MEDWKEKGKGRIKRRNIESFGRAQDRYRTRNVEYRRAGLREEISNPSAVLRTSIERGMWNYEVGDMRKTDRGNTQSSPDNIKGMRRSVGFQGAIITFVCEGIG